MSPARKRSYARWLVKALIKAGVQRHKIIEQEPGYPDGYYPMAIDLETARLACRSALAKAEANRARMLLRLEHPELAAND